MYTNAPQVDLLLNGKSLGPQPVGDPSHTTNKSYGVWSVDWAAGNITGVAMDQSGKSLATHVVPTSGQAAKIVLTLDAPNEKTGTGSKLLMDGEDMALVRATLVDAQGNFAHSANNSVTFTITSGSASIVGSHNGDPTCLEFNQVP